MAALSIDEAWASHEARFGLLLVEGASLLGDLYRDIPNRYEIEKWDAVRFSNYNAVVKNNFKANVPKLSVCNHMIMYDITYLIIIK